MPLNGFMELAENDLMVIDGGVNYDRVFAGTATFLGATLAVAAMSEPIGWVAIGTYLALSAASGAYI
ncbi:bacteriocin-type signal sequence [Aceticella autotrophica]|uniref:Bacteriocin-type signal sequence n=1 Tax=Aceticella autotrophica TaxID=2755338 RepID=A0A974Y429_9THEO|nr:hypothetical protein [Aceticella autotrophica]QSZ26472.1 bacteriocin-type signal sequence [Aceticella autotrophica]